MKKRLKIIGVIFFFAVGYVAVWMKFVKPLIGDKWQESALFILVMIGLIVFVNKLLLLINKKIYGHPIMGLLIEIGGELAFTKELTFNWKNELSMLSSGLNFAKNEIEGHKIITSRGYLTAREKWKSYELVNLPQNYGYIDFENIETRTALFIFSQWLGNKELIDRSNEKLILLPADEKRENIKDQICINRHGLYLRHFYENYQKSRNRKGK